MTNPGALVHLEPSAARRTAPTRRDFLAGGRPDRTAGGFWLRVHRRAMACRVEITLASEDAAWLPAAREALDEIDRLEETLSVFRPTSLISRINRAAAETPVEADPATLDLLERCVELHRATAGAFDITSTPLSRCWGFLFREGCLPSPDAIDEARRSVGCDAVRIDRHAGTVCFDRPGIEVNLNAIGKGYALDRVASRMRRRGVARALLSAGRSSLLAIGSGRIGWDVEIVSPRRSAPLATVRLRDAALGTSGAGEQFIVVNGTRYGHVIDPRTGWPASGVLSASVIAPSAAAADALSTAFLIGGAGLAERYCAAHPGVVAVITEEDARKPIVIGSASGMVSV
jgi:FAD:protein FMN transferase